MTNIKTYRDGKDRLIIVLENCTGELAIKANNFVLDVLGLQGMTSDEDLPKEAIPQDIPAVIPEVVEEEDVAPQRWTPIISATEKPFEEPIPLQDAYNTPVQGPSGILGNAIAQKDTEAIVVLCTKGVKTMASATKISVMKICKAYIKEDCSRRSPDYASSAEIQKFFKIYEPLIKDAIQQILGSAGYANTEDFFALTDEYIQQDAYASILESLIQRASV